jgi:hypothetical protein
MTTISDLTLNFPTFAHKLQKSDGKLMIFDEVGKKYRVLTPEEWVRQHCLNYLLHHLKYPTNLIKLEQSLKINQLKRRSDITIYDRQGNLFLLVECKAPQINLDAHVIKQVSQYQSQIKSPFLAITNGITHHIFAYNQTTQSIQELSQFPTFL